MSDPAPMTPQVGAFVPLPDVPKLKAPKRTADYDRLMLRMKKRKEQLPDDESVMIVFDWREFAAAGMDGHGNEVTKEMLIKRLENRIVYMKKTFGADNYSFFRRGVVVYGRYKGPIAG